MDRDREVEATLTLTAIDKLLEEMHYINQVKTKTFTFT